MQRNPVFIAIGVILLLALALAASLLGSTTPPVAQPTPASPPPGPRILRFGHNIPEDSALHQAAARFAREVSARSGGQLQVEVFPAQQLGTDDQMLEMARQGQLDILLTPTAKISSAIPAMQYADLPFYFPEREDLYAMLDGEPGRLLLDKLRSIDLVGVTFWENGFKHFTGKRPLTRPEDFQGMNVRIMKSRLLQEQFGALGAHAIPIDFHTTRQALADGVVDGQENPLVAIVSMGLHEVQPHLTLSSHGYLGYVFMISARVLATLPADQQALLLDSARALTPWERDETHRREATLLETIRQAGVSIHTLTPEERRRFAQATANVPAMFEQDIGPDILSRTEELLDAKYGQPGSRILIGLDADLSQDSRLAGLAIKRGAQLAIDEINAGGGVLGKSLKLIARDHRGQSNLGINNVEHFGAMPDLVAVLGGLHANVPIAEMDTLHRIGLPFLAPWSTAAPVVDNGHTPNYVFRDSANDALAAPYIIEHVRQHYHAPAILFENSVWGRGNLESMTRALEGQGEHFVFNTSFNRGQQDFDALVTQALKAGADALVMIANPEEGGAIVQAMARQQSPLPVVAHWGITGSDFWDANRTALAKVDLRFFQTFTFLDNPRPVAQQLAARYAHNYASQSPRNIVAPQGTAQAYDLVHLLALAIRQAGSTDRAAIRDALEHLPPWDGAVKRYAPAFSNERHEALDSSNYRMARYDSDGAIVPLTP